MQRSLQHNSREAKSEAKKQGQRGGTALWLSMVTGAAAGGLGTLITTPMDVVKTRIMVSPHIYRYALQCFHVSALDFQQGRDAKVNADVCAMCSSKDNMLSFRSACLLGRNAVVFLFLALSDDCLQIEQKLLASHPDDPCPGEQTLNVFFLLNLLVLCKTCCLRMVVSCGLALRTSEYVLCKGINLRPLSRV
jgi:hypothetical protein